MMYFHSTLEKVKCLVEMNRHAGMYAVCLSRRNFLSTAPLQYVPRIVFTQATIGCLINNKTENALHSETIILNYICGDLISHGLSN